MNNKRDLDLLVSFPSPPEFPQNKKRGKWRIPPQTTHECGTEAEAVRFHSPKKQFALLSPNQFYVFCSKNVQTSLKNTARTEKERIRAFFVGEDERSTNVFFEVTQNTLFYRYTKNTEFSVFFVIIYCSFLTWKQNTIFVKKSAIKYPIKITDRDGTILNVSGESKKIIGKAIHP